MPPNCRLYNRAIAEKAGGAAHSAFADWQGGRNVVGSVLDPVRELWVLDRAFAFHTHVALKAPNQ